MTTKPKVRKYRIQRNALLKPAQDAAAVPAPPATEKTDPARVPPRSAPPATPPLRAGEVSSSREVADETAIDKIRREGLTGRQLRMARRVAQKHGLAPTSDFDAVRQLRAMDIDPFQRSNMIELAVSRRSDAAKGDNDDADHLPAAKAKVQLPEPLAEKENSPALNSRSPAERREAEITAIQRDIARRRRRKLLLLLTRLTFFVFLPTLLAGYYYFVIATPMYSTKSQFLILQADGQGGSGLGSFLPTQYATSQDSIAVQSYLQSTEAMLKLDEDASFISHFSQPQIDPLQRLAEGATNADAYKIFKNYVKIGYDPTEGVIKMEVFAPTPELAVTFSERLIVYAEERVDDLSRQKREDAVASAEDSLEQAKRERREAQEVLVQLQEGTFIDPEAEIASIRALINNVEMQLQEKQLQLNSLLNNPRPSQPRVDAARADIRLLRAEMEKQTRRMTEATAGDSSLAAKAARIQMAQADLATADLFLQSALQSEKQTALEARRQVRYLTVPVRPVAPDEPSYPRAFENTLLAFLIFSGIYLMISLTASILREQVST